MRRDDHHRRRTALDAALDLARADPEGPLPFPPAVRAAFAGRRELLLALHHRWTTRLTGRVEPARAEADRDPALDPVAAVAAAWRAAAAEEVLLRRVLDTHADALGPALDGERRLLARAAGLAGEADGPEEAARVGAAYLALVRTAAAKRPRRPGLAASA